MTVTIFCLYLIDVGSHTVQSDANLEGLATKNHNVIRCSQPLLV